MGVSSDIVMPTQVVASYHRIDRVPEFSWDEKGLGKIQLEISQYLNYQARLNGANPITKKYKSLNLDRDITGILRYILYRGVLPLLPEFETAQTVEDGELGNMLRLLKYLNPAEMSAMIFALKDILDIIKVDPETYRDWYEELKTDTLSTIE